MRHIAWEGDGLDHQTNGVSRTGVGRGCWGGEVPHRFPGLSGPSSVPEAVLVSWIAGNGVALAGGHTGNPRYRQHTRKLYLCAIKDVYSNRIVGYSIDVRIRAALAVAALRNAALREPVTGLILQSDWGSQFRVDHVRPRRPGPPVARIDGPRRRLRRERRDGIILPSSVTADAAVTCSRKSSAGRCSGFALGCC
jgi:transposase InsO family protein